MPSPRQILTQNPYLKSFKVIDVTDKPRNDCMALYKFRKYSERSENRHLYDPTVILRPMRCVVSDFVVGPTNS